MSDLLRTPLYQEHEKLGAKFTEFGGWEMPVRYSGIREEHLCVRSAVGLFDVSHMGEIFVKGSDSLSFLQYVTTNDLSSLVDGQAQYGLLCNEAGGVVDDIITYRLQADSYMICANASNSDKDYQWLKDKLERSNCKEVSIENLSSSYAQIAIQGPKAEKLLSEVLGRDLSTVAAFEFIRLDSDRDLPQMVARTGYTGEDGFEVFCNAEDAVKLWSNLMDRGTSYGVQAIGLGARDTLRLEVAYPLHGHELREDLSAYSSNVSWTIKHSKEDFVGKSALESVKGKTDFVLKGFKVIDKGIARDGAEIVSEEGRKVGWVSSGTMTPTLGQAVCLGFIERSIASDDQKLYASVRGRTLEIEKVKLPFYRREK